MAKKSEKLLSTTAFAALVGISRQRVVDGIKSGILTTAVIKVKQRGRDVYKIYEGRGLKQWNDHIDPAKQRDQEKQNETRALSTPPEETGENGLSHYQKAKAHKELFTAKMAELQYREKAGELVPAAQVKAESFRIARRVRDSIMGVGERIAAELVNMDDARVISVFIKEQIAVALKDLDSLNNVGKK